MPTLAEIRARLVAQDNKTNNNNNYGSSDRTLYPHWNIPENGSCTVRFLPDGNQNNPIGLWQERQLINLWFSGVKNGDAKPVKVVVPCMEMWNEVCPILTEIRPWYKDDSLKNLAGKYWKKRSYVMQGFVRENPIADDETPENPIRKFIINPSIQGIVKSILLDPDQEELPTHYQKGLDFRIIKTVKGEYADYTTSTWSRKESSLTAAELEAIERFGLNDLSVWLPKRPGAAELVAIKEMFEASVNGEEYDAARWGKFYKPSGLGGNDEESTPVRSTAAPVAKQETVVKNSDDEPPFELASPSAAPAAARTMKADDILAKIRNRQAK